MCANGPLAWSVLAFNHAMIFHSYVAWLNDVMNRVSRTSLMFLAFVLTLPIATSCKAHMTSVVVHVSPLLLSYGLRWYAAPVSETSMGATHFLVCDGDAESCLDVSFQTLLFGAMARFYLWWLILYYIWIFVALGSYIERNSYQTLWDRILVSFSIMQTRNKTARSSAGLYLFSMCAEVMKPVGPILQKLLKRWPKLVVQLVYLFLVCTLLLFASAVCAAQEVESVSRFLKSSRILVRFFHNCAGANLPLKLCHWLVKHSLGKHQLLPRYLLLPPQLGRRLTCSLGCKDIRQASWPEHELHDIHGGANARLVHLIFSTATMCVAVVLWHSQLAHFMFVCAIGISTVKPLSLVKHRCFELLLDLD